MDPQLLNAAVVWSALGLGLVCVVLRLIPRRPPEPGTPEGECD
jgi:hypothetical protein